MLRLEPVPVAVPMRFGDRVRPYLVRDEPRVAAIATIESPVGELTVACTHLSSSHGGTSGSCQKVTTWSASTVQPASSSIVDRGASGMSCSGVSPRASRQVPQHAIRPP